MKRILLINNGYPSFEFKNNCTYIKSIEEALLTASFDVELVVIRKRSNSFFANVFSYFTFYARILITPFRKFNYIYINHLPHALIPIFIKSLFFNEKIWVHWHGDDLLSNFLLSRITRILLRRKLLKINHHITPSKYFKNELSIRCKISSENIYISPSGGVDTNIFHNRKNKISLLKKSSIVLGFPSALSKEKGLDFLLLLIKNRDVIQDQLDIDIIFEVINYGKDREYLNDYVHLKWLIVNEIMPKELMPNFYERVDIVLMFSQRQAESLGLVSLEAMSCGCPVIGIKNYAMVEYIMPGQSGEFTIYNNLVSFIETLKTIVYNYEEYSPREIIELSYSKQKVVNDYKSIYS